MTVQNGLIYSEVAGTTAKSHLVKLCTTRFVERHTAVITVWHLLPYIVVSLDAMQSWKIQTTGHDARTLLNSILKADFLVGLICLREVSAMLHPVSLSLQRENVDLVQALTDIEDLITVLKQWRTEAEQEFSRLFVR